MIEVLKVSSRSNPNAVAGALAGVIRTAGKAEVQVVGAGALNQAVKAVAIARGYLTPTGTDLVCIPTFADIDIDGERRTAIRLVCQDRSGAAHDPAGAVVDLRDGKAEGHTDRNTDVNTDGNGAGAADGRVSGPPAALVFKD